MDVFDYYCTFEGLVATYPAFVVSEGRACPRHCPNCGGTLHQEVVRF
jgi:hypothetical protein